MECRTLQVLRRPAVNPVRARTREPWICVCQAQSDVKLFGDLRAKTISFRDIFAKSAKRVEFRKKYEISPQSEEKRRTHHFGKLQYSNPKTVYYKRSAGRGPKGALFLEISTFPQIVHFSLKIGFWGKMHFWKTFRKNRRPEIPIVHFG